MNKGGYTYILTNKRNTVLYIGVTSDLERRLHEHRGLNIPGFTSKYRIYKLLYFEHHDGIEAAIRREKQLKGKTRAKKEQLIASMNPRWRDLSLR